MSGSFYTFNQPNYLYTTPMLKNIFAAPAYKFLLLLLLTAGLPGLGVGSKDE
jgi:hypothetical protein